MVKRKLKKSFLPRIFISETWDGQRNKISIRKCKWVISFVGQKVILSLLKKKKRRVLGDFDGDGTALKTVEVAPYKVGDPVKVTDGHLWTLDSYKG